MINIAVLFGGKSVEHEVSVITAMQALAVIEKMEGYCAIPIYVSKEGVFYVGDGLDKIENYKNIPELLKHAKVVDMVPSGVEGVARVLPLESKMAYDEDNQRIDVVFPIIHGTGGEDGTLQGKLDLLGVPYIGCGTVAAAITMDKTLTKSILNAYDVPQLPAKWFYSEYIEESMDFVVQDCVGSLDFPMIVKPADVGSSVGVTTAETREELEEALLFSSQFSSKVIVEYKLENNYEINISVLGDHTSQELSVLERPLSDNEFLTYEDKYVGGGEKGMSAAKREIPARIPEELKTSIEEIARKAFVVLDCAGVVRIDFLVDKEELEPYVCELNTIPGSLSFYLWEATNKNFQQLIEDLLRIAFKGYRMKKGIVRSVGTNLLSQGNALGIKK